MKLSRLFICEKSIWHPKFVHHLGANIQCFDSRSWLEHKAWITPRLAKIKIRGKIHLYGRDWADADDVHGDAHLHWRTWCKQTKQIQWNVFLHFLFIQQPPGKIGTNFFHFRTTYFRIEPENTDQKEKKNPKQLTCIIGTNTFIIATVEKGIQDFGDVKTNIGLSVNKKKIINFFKSPCRYSTKATKMNFLKKFP